MNIQLTTERKWSGRWTGVLVFEGERHPLMADGQMVEENFTGRWRETAVVIKGKNRIVCAGLGRRNEFELERVRSAVARMLRRAGELGMDDFGVYVPAGKGIKERDFVAPIVEGAILGAYRFLQFRGLRPDETRLPGGVSLIFKSEQDLLRAQPLAVAAEHRARAVCFVRDLVNEPAGKKPPLALASRMRECFAGENIKFQVLERAELEKMGMGGIIGVGQGSHNPPCLVHMTYQPRTRTKKKVVFVGKGITFDSGGLSLKTSQQMETMKDDMAGAATVFGIFRYLKDVDLPLEVHGIVPLAENLPGGGAQKPGDVIRHFNGKTVEVMNTDAEGRLLLADALAYGATFKPDLMIDIATLTGACVVALGNEMSGLLGTDRKTIAQLIALGKEEGEFFWELPLFERYRAHMKSHIADLKNIGKPQNAGTIIGGLFLSEFVPKTTNWVHIDIAGTAFTSEGWDYCPPGATGVPLRTLLALLAVKG